jgi:SAM-dependent MidA family methyltransferase
VSDRLRRVLVERARTRGPLRFSEFMETALYDPEDGFFARASAGREFATSATISPLFGALLAEQMRESWESLGKPAVFTVVDAGAGDGSLARSLRAALAAADVPSRYIAIERDGAARARLAAAGLETWPSLDDLAPFTGCVVANELLDNIPFDVFRARNDEVVEVRVGADGDALVEVEVPAPGARPGTEAPGIRTFVAGVARALANGYAFVLDYGYVAGESPEPIRGYHAHRLADDLLADPGATDITGPIDFDALAREARAAELEVWGPVTQRDALHALGYRAALDAMRAEQQRDESEGRWREAIATFGARNEAAMLVDPAGLGSLRVMAFGTRGLPEPRAARAAGPRRAR